MALRATSRVPILPTAPPPEFPPLHFKKMLGIPRIPQVQEGWCWAASAVMAINYFHPTLNLDKCQLVRYIREESQGLKDFNCCQTPNAPECDGLGAEIAEIHLVHCRFGVAFTYELRALSQSELMSEINNDRPVEIGVLWRDGGGHVMLIDGWRLSFKGLYFHVNDPLDWEAGTGPPLDSLIYHRALVDTYGIGDWVESWHHMARK